MTNKEEKQYWENFKEKYGNGFKRISGITTGGAYVSINKDEVVTFDKSDKMPEATFLIGDVANYIYDLEDIKEESLIIFDKYNKLLNKYNKLKQDKEDK